MAENIIQLYVDDEKTQKGYPITSAKLVINEKGESMEDFQRAIKNRQDSFEKNQGELDLQRTLAETSRVNAEATRNINEETRNSSEQTRERKEADRENLFVTSQQDRNSKYQLAEDTRNANYSTAEASREDKYVSAETNRNNRYNVAESERNTKFDVEENKRKSSEETRKTSEAKRVSDETARTNSESIRQSNEASRGNAETTRMSSESSRVSAENTRVTSENTRKSSETSRVNAENIRVSEFNNIKDEFGTFETVINSKVGSDLYIDGDIDVTNPDINIELSKINDKTNELENKGIQNQGKIIELEKNIINTNSQLAENTYYDNYLTRKIRNKETIDVFLCGDSITAGVGSSGYNTDGGTLILTDTSNHNYYEANSVSNSWANLFRRFVVSLNQNNTFFNGGIGGKYVSFFMTNKEKYITNNKDIIVCMLGTNDRGDFANANEFKVAYTDYLKFLNSKCNFLIIMSPTPLNADYDKEKNFTQYEGVQVVREICKEQGYFFIDNYTNVYEKAYLKNLREIDIMSDSAHPNDKGYALIWENIKSSLGLYDEFTLYETNTEKPVIYAKYGQYTKDTLPSQFPKGSIIYSLVTGADAIAQGYPDTRGGILITDTTTSNTNYYYQYYHVVNRNIIYKRSVKILDEWNLFEEFSLFKIKDNNTVVNASVPKTDIALNQVLFNTVSDLSGIPSARAGFIETILPHVTSTAYGQQKYYPYGRNYKFARGVNGTGDGWFDWKQETHNTSLQTFTQMVGSIPANSSLDVDLTIVGGLNNNFMNLLTMESNLKVGITYCTFKKSTSVFTVRFSNLTDSAIDVGQVVMRFTTLEVVSF